MPGLDGFAVLKNLIERNRACAASAALKGRPESDGEAVPTPHIVFATAYDQYAVRAFNVNAVDYLLKPFDQARVQEAVDRVHARLASPGFGGSPILDSSQSESPQVSSSSGSSNPIESQLDTLLRMLNPAVRAQQPAKLIVQAQSRLLLIDQSEVCFATIDEGVIRIVTRAFEGQSKCRTLEELQDQLDSARFWRAHRGFLVNIDQIREVVPWFKSSFQLRMNDKQQTEIPVSRNQTKRLKELFNL
jgi:two-component system LytT family response regulator/two-component system response regulator LytT